MAEKHLIQCIANRNRQFPWQCVLLILAVFLIFASIFVIIIPPFENSDELEHVAYVAYWASLITSADNTSQLLAEARQQRYQAPLFCLSCLPIALALGTHKHFKNTTA